jgi:hypothetical protein
MFDRSVPVAMLSAAAALFFGPTTTQYATDLGSVQLCADDGEADGSCCPEAGSTCTRDGKPDMSNNYFRGDGKCCKCEA